MILTPPSFEDYSIIPDSAPAGRFAGFGMSDPTDIIASPIADLVIDQATVNIFKPREKARHQVIIETTTEETTI